MDAIEAIEAFVLSGGGLFSGTNTWSAANTFSHATGVTTNTITERTAAAGVTIDGTLVKDGGLLLTDAGTLAWSDITLSRAVADQLQLDDWLSVVRGAGANPGISTRVSGNANPRFQVNADGTVGFGDGTAAIDTTLYRAAANTLKTDDGFIYRNRQLFGDGDTTPSVAGGNFFACVNTSGTSITTYDDGTNGQVVVVQGNANTTWVHSSGFLLAGAANLVSGANTTLTMIYTGGEWIEVARKAT